MKKTKGLSYDTIKDADVINYIDIQPNKSKYVWGLVRDDMKKDDIEAKIRKIIKEYMSDFQPVEKEKRGIESIAKILDM